MNSDVGQAPPLKPILCVGAGGRTGSTLIMSILGAMPEVAFDRIPPHEVMHLAHLADLAMTWQRWTPPQPSMQIRPRLRRAIEHRVLPRIYRERRDTNKAGVPPGGLVAMRRLPVEHLLVDESLDPPFHERFLADGWTTLAGALQAAHSERTGHDATWYAEKAPFWLIDRIDGLIDHHLVVRVRDPRDVLCSMRAFFKANPIPVGSERAKTTGRSLEVFVRDQTDFARWLQQHRDDPHVTVLRYEDVVIDAEAHATRLAQRLGTTIDSHDLQGLISRSQAGHVTAGNVSSSVGRWKRDLTAEQQEHASSELRECIDLLGYDA